MFDNSVQAFNQLWEAKKYEAQILEQKDQEQSIYNTQQDQQSFASLMDAKLQTQTVNEAQIQANQQFTTSFESATQTQLMTQQSVENGVQAQLLSNQAFDSQMIATRMLDNETESKWLNQGWQESKDQGSMLAKIGIAAKTAPIVNNSQTPEDVRRTLQPSAKMAQTVRASKDTDEREVVVRQQQTGTKTVGQGQSMPEKTKETTSEEKTFEEEVAIKKEKSGSDTPVFYGTQSATKTESKMSPFFSMQSDLSQHRGRQWHGEEEEAEEMAAVANVRMGALVEAPAEYKNVAVQETLMPRLLELVQRLNAMGQSWARVVVPVDARTQVVVRFNTQAGRVKMHLATSSNELQKSVSDSWGELSRQAAEHGITLDQPTFEKEN